VDAIDQYQSLLLPKDRTYVARFYAADSKKNRGGVARVVDFRGLKIAPVSVTVEHDLCCAYRRT